MKKFSLILIILFSLGSIFASHENKHNNSKEKETVFTHNQFENIVVVRILDLSGKEVYKEIYNSSSTNRKLCNYNALEQGEYILNIRTREENITRQIYIDNFNQISFKN